MKKNCFGQKNDCSGRFDENKFEAALTGFKTKDKAALYKECP